MGSLLILSTNRAPFNPPVHRACSLARPCALRDAPGIFSIVAVGNMHAVQLAGAVLVHVAVHIDSPRSSERFFTRQLFKSNFVGQSGGFDSLDGANLVFVGSAAADPYCADNFVSIRD